MLRPPRELERGKSSSKRRSRSPFRAFSRRKKKEDTSSQNTSKGDTRPTRSKSSRAVGREVPTGDKKKSGITGKLKKFAGVKLGEVGGAVLSEATAGAITVSGRGDVNLDLSNVEVTLSSEPCSPAAGTAGPGGALTPEQLKLARTSNKLRWNSYDAVSIPSVVWTLTSLTNLEISNSSRILIVPEDISRLTSLETLRLSNNGLQRLPDAAISALPLKTLDVKGNALTAFPVMGPTLVWKDTLKVLDVSNNSIVEMPEQLSCLQALETLHCGNNAFPLLASALASLPQLRTLTLEGHTSTSALGVAKALASAGQLYKGAHDLPLAAMAPQLCSLTQLTTLRVCMTKVTVLPAGITRLQNLKTLWLNQNRLKALPEDLDQLTGLKDLRLRSNNISVLPLCVGNMTELTYLDLGMNKLKSLPEEIASLTLLEILKLRNNRLLTLPDFARMKRLKTLQLRDNKLGPTLPACVFELPELDKLVVRNNGLEVLPVSIGDLVALRHLDFSDNAIPSVPYALFGLSRLRTLEMENTSITVIPPGIMKLRALGKLNVQGCCELRYPPYALIEKSYSSDVGGLFAGEDSKSTIDTIFDHVRDSPAREHDLMWSRLRLLYVGRADEQSVLYDTPLDVLQRISTMVLWEPRAGRSVFDAWQDELASSALGRFFLGIFGGLLESLRPVVESYWSMNQRTVTTLGASLLAIIGVVAIFMWII